MGAEQLNILGDAAQPVDDELGVTQRAVMRELRRVAVVTRDEAGAIAHANRGKHAVDERCRYCGVDGAPILAALVKRGLAEKANGGVTLPRPKPVAAPDDTDPFPPGF